MLNKKVYIHKPMPRILSVAMFFIFIGCIYLQHIFSTQNYGTLLLLILFVPFCISIILVLIKNQPQFLFVLPIALTMPIISPVFMCVYAITLTPENSSSVIKNIPLVILIYCIVMTFIEFILIKWDEIPKKRITKIFKDKGGEAFFKEGEQVLDYSPFRHDNSWLFSGKVRTLQKIIICLGFVYVFYVHATKPSGEGFNEGLEAIAILLSFIGFMCQPYLLQVAITTQLALMKQRGKI